MIRNKLKEKRGAPERSEGDLLDQAVRDMSSEKFLTEEFYLAALSPFHQLLH